MEANGLGKGVVGVEEDLRADLDLASVFLIAPFCKIIVHKIQSWDQFEFIYHDTDDSVTFYRAPYSSKGRGTGNHHTISSNHI